ncbi:MAG: S8 family serine peptidase [Sedimentisphaerales bacterium]|nr:S8 family serine peptidase [Sedimentisphaerales bacterium]
MLKSTDKRLLSLLWICILTASSVWAEDPNALMPVQPLAFNHAGIHALRQIDPDLTGFGVNVAVICRSITYIDDVPQNDYRSNFAHRCLYNTPVTFHDQGSQTPGTSPHSTAICSLLFGRDDEAAYPPLGRFRYEGVLPEAQAQIYQFDHFVTENIINQVSPESGVLSASFGNEFENWWTRGIEALAQHQGLVVVAAIGNGTDAYDPPLYPAAGANVIGVGVVDSVNAAEIAVRLANFSLAHPEHSSHGPTGAGRCKPDIVAPGNCLVADANDPNRYEPAGNYSSFATPVVAGTIGLLIQKASQEPTLAPAVSGVAHNCIIKAILLNSAKKLPFWHKGHLTTDDDHTVPLDHMQGAGMVDAVAAYEQLTTGRAKPGNVPSTAWDKNTLHVGTTPSQVYQINLPQPAGKIITATAVWNHHYADSYPFAAAARLDANLKLEVWAVDPNDPDRDYLLDYSDSEIDNVEHIYRPADANYTDYEIIVAISNPEEASPAPQHYGLAWSVSEAPAKESLFHYDLNADGIVDTADIAVLMNNLIRWRQAEEDYLIGDLNTNGVIDANDFEILLEHNTLKADWYVEPAEAIADPTHLAKDLDALTESSL